MDYYKKYLELYNGSNIRGGKNKIDSILITSKVKNLLTQEDTYLNYPLTWMMNFNLFSRDPLLLMIFKLSRNDVKDIISNVFKEDTETEAAFNNFLNCLFVKVNTEVELKNGNTSFPKRNINNILKSYAKEYDVLSNKIIKGRDEVNVKYLIEYFIATHRAILLIAKGGDPSEEEANQINQHILLCRELYKNWKEAVDTFYSISKDSSPTTISNLANPNSLFSKLHTEAIRKVISNKINKLTENSLVTYLKIRNEGDKYNQRYNVYLENINDETRKVPQSMYLTGPDPNDNVFFYNFNKNHDNGNTPNVLELRNRPANSKFNQYYYSDDLTKNLILDEEKNNVKDVLKYDYGRLYGPFTRIFSPKEKNNVVADNCTEILNKLDDNKSVFVLGYGASGAGKTSTLIYYNGGKTDDEKNGILLQILKKLDYLDEITLTVHELYSDTLEIKTQKNEYNDIVFVKEGNDFVIKKGQPEKKGSLKELTREIIKDNNDNVTAINWNPTTYNWTVNNGEFDIVPPHPKLQDYKKESGLFDAATKTYKPITKLSDFVLTVVDFVRKVEPTTNNPNSSRSHLLVYINLPYISKVDGKIIMDKTKSKYLIFGDLAGVENKFTCDQVDTQIKFLGIKKQPTPTIPYYSKNPNLSYIDIPNDEESKQILKFFTYDAITKKVNDQDYKTRIELFKLLSKEGKLNFSDLPSGLKNDFPVSNEVRPDNDFKGFFNKFNKTVPKNKGSDAGSSILETIKNTKVPTQPIIDVYEFINPKMTEGARTIFSKASPVLAVKMINGSETNTGDKEDVGGKKFKAFVEGYEKFISNPDNISKLTMDPKDANKTINNPPSGEIQDSLKEYIIDFYKQKYPTLIESVKDKSKIIKINSLLNDLENNKKLLESSGVVDRCLERMYEGLFINDALRGMAQRISTLIQEINSKKVDNLENASLIDNIPLIKEPCYEYFCNKEHESCFRPSQATNGKSNYNQGIIGDIEEKMKVDTKGGVGQTLNDLTVVVFLVLNINRFANDPPKMPFIDITKLKLIREEYQTFRYYYNGDDDIPTNIIKDSIKQIVKLFTGRDSDELPKKEHANDTNETTRPEIGSYFYILNKFRFNLGDAVDDVITRYSNITPAKKDFFNNVIDLIEGLNNINSLGPIGTLEFLNSVKNVFNTDIPCNLLIEKQDGPKNPDSSLEPININMFKNMITNESFVADIGKQKGLLEKEVKRLAENAMASSDGAPTPLPSPPSLISEMIGGYLNQLGYNEKQHLINEYRQLKKIYKSMK